LSPNKAVVKIIEWPAGTNRQIWFRDLVVASLDGAVFPVYTGQTSITTTTYGTASNPSAAAQRNAPAGNLLADGQHSYVYNAESQMASLDSGATAYVYDAAGMRVRKTTGMDWTEYLYWGADPVAERDQTGAWTEYVFFPAPGSGGAKRVARREPAGAVYYYFSDHLGSASVVTDPAGVIKEESDYYPYGGERVLTDLLPKQNYKFTGKERDTESGLDYFGARYYSSRMGRWLTPDWANGAEAVPYADFGDPQSLNLYGYVGNRTTREFDKDGHCAFICTAVIGAAIGGVIGGGVEAVRQWRQDGRISNWKAVGANAAGGAIAGAITGATLGSSALIGTGYGTTAAVAGASNVIGGGVTRALGGQKVADPKAVVTDAVSGAAGGVAGKATQQLLVKGITANAAEAAKVNSAYNPSQYELVNTVAGVREIGSLQRATTAASTAAGSVGSTAAATAGTPTLTQPNLESSPQPQTSSSQPLSEPTKKNE
jgi:RHS repeat-associated protein